MATMNPDDLEAQPSSLRHPGVDHVLPSASLKSLAHPLRVRIYDELSAYGPLTASGLAERLGESSGATSYHLRQLERAGLIREDTARGKGRERWWERVPGSIAIPDARSLPAGSAERLAVKLVEDEWFRSREQNFREFVAEGEAVFGPEWLDIATSDTINLRLTPEQLSALVADLDVVFMKFIDAYKRTPSPGSRPVQIHLNAFPLVRGEPTDESIPKEHR
ncbi:helix-turn-helix domain-containing protein [Agromyces sp. SYSU K20354]|uniref:ArsR/SmtB family transcription factor n=1 Tax=Agromyces cavernae TaxID=2898659 RepID=UPI001E435076|nr:helix-turn-helix domain-containing protein [Agromyces cavernae]MCD2440894.1 helix-turn-helix domain-containing protein [Agromyces cavernae]